MTDTIDSTLIDSSGKPLALGVTPEFIKERFDQAEEKLSSSPGGVPTFDRIIVEQDEGSATYVKDGKIVRPDEYRDHASTGVIVDMSIGCRGMLERAGHRIGDRILWAKFAGTMGVSKDGVRIPWKTKKVITLMAKDIVWNFSILERLERGEWVLVKSEATGEYEYRESTKEAK